MKKKPASQSGFFNPRVLISFVPVSVGVFLALFGLGAYPAASALTQAGEESAASVPTIISPMLRSNEQQGDLQLPSKRYHLQLNIRKVTYTLPALDQKSIETRAANQIGVNRPVGLSSQSVGKRFTNSDSTQLLVLAIKSPGAKRLRAHFDNFELPAGDEVYLHAPSDNSTVAGPYRDKGPWGDRDFWSSSIEGDTLIIEYHIHSTQGSFRIPEISHIYSDPQRTQADPTPDVLECEVDASCYTDIRKNSVGRIVFVRAGGSYVCTGTLLNDRPGDFIPYFLTANHCVSTQTVAQTVETYWFYQTTGCNSGVLRSDIGHSTQGANLLVTDSSKDFALLRLVDTPPGGAVFAGWDSSIIPVNTTAYGLHHPGGYSPPDLESYLRRAEGPISSTSGSCGVTGLVSAYQIDWTSGLVEPGSSGSGLLYTGGLIGVLSCINTDLSCTSRRALYSKFSDFYPLIQPYIDNSTNYTITTTSSPSNGGTTSGGGTFAAGTSHTVTATANSGYSFVNWTESSLVVSTSTSYTFTLNSNRNLVANFVVSPNPTPTPSSTTLGNISTRLRVGTGDNALIGGFIVTGTQPKKLIVRAIGPSLPLAGALADPVIELRNSSGGLIASNDDWRTDQEAEIIATGIPPSNTLESAILMTLPANNSAYTAIVRGYNNLTGIGVVEAYDLDRTVNSKLANISTRGFVQTGDNVLIGGLIVLGQDPLTLRVIVRAIGPSLPVPGALGDPTLELRDGNGALIAANDNWRTDQEAEIIATTIPPSNDLESAIVRNLAPGNYTAIVRGVNSTTGIAVVEAYGLN